MHFCFAPHLPMLHVIISTCILQTRRSRNEKMHSHPGTPSTSLALAHNPNGRLHFHFQLHSFRFARGSEVVHALPSISLTSPIHLQSIERRPSIMATSSAPPSYATRADTNQSDSNPITDLETQPNLPPSFISSFISSAPTVSLPPYSKVPIPTTITSPALPTATLPARPTATSPSHWWASLHILDRSIFVVCAIGFVTGFGLFIAAFFMAWPNGET